jgi:hypothetical protein
MKNIDIDALLENQSRKNEFAACGLDFSQVFCSDPDDLKRENLLLRRLLDWVQKYTECGDREQMEAEGYRYPPIDPDISPEDDWYRFELWLKGQPLRKKLKDQLRLRVEPRRAKCF